MKYYINTSKKKGRSKKVKVDDFEKIRVTRIFDEFIESQLKPNHITPEHQNDRYSYITDFYTKWHGRYFYLYAIYHDPSKNAISPSFDVKIARLEYIRSNSYSLAYMRHTGKWYVLFFGISIDECLEAIDNMPHFLLQ